MTLASSFVNQYLSQRYGIDAISLVFLDVDGVVNTPASVALAKEKGMHYCFDADCVARLNKIVEITNAWIVVSGAMRIDETPQELRDIFSANGFKYPERIFSATPNLAIVGYSRRGVEITEWLEDHLTELVARAGAVMQFIIVDDDETEETLGETLAPFLVKTTWTEGLQDEHVQHIWRLTAARLGIDDKEMPS